MKSYNFSKNNFSPRLIGLNIFKNVLKIKLFFLLNSWNEKLLLLRWKANSPISFKKIIICHYMSKRSSTYYTKIHIILKNNNERESCSQKTKGSPRLKGLLPN